MDIQSIDAEHIVGVSVNRFSVHRKMRVGDVIQVHVDNGEVFTITKPSRARTYQNGTTGMVVTSDVRPIPWSKDLTITTELYVGQQISIGDADTKLMVTAITLIPES